MKPANSKKAGAFVKRGGITMSQFIDNLIEYATRPNCSASELRFFTRKQAHALNRFVKKEQRRGH